MLGISTTNLWERLKLPTKLTRDLFWGVLVGVTFSLSSTTLALIAQQWRKRNAVSRVPPRPIEIRSEEVVDGVIGLIGGLAVSEPAM
jgi:cysteine synthase A